MKFLYYPGCSLEASAREYDQSTRALMEAVGVQDILTKRIGSSNPGNVLRASLACLQQLKAPHEVAKLRGITMNQLFHGHDAPEPEPEPEVEEVAEVPAEAPTETPAEAAGGEA